MKRNLWHLLGILLLTTTLAACLSTPEEDIVQANDTAITQFSVKSVKQYLHTTSSKGTDSVYVRNLDVSKYRFNIDQVNRVIYNPDSLPMGVDATKIVCIFTVKKASTVTLTNFTGDSVRPILTTDSIDFSRKREIRVYDSEGQKYRSYQVWVNVHKEKENTFAWQQVTNNAPWADLQGLKLAFAGKLATVSGIRNGQLHTYTSTDGKSWEESPFTLTETSLANHSLVAYHDTLYRMNIPGLIEQSVNGKDWTEFAVQADKFKSLLGVGREGLYILTQNNEMGCLRWENKTWTDATYTDDINQLPNGSRSIAVLQAINNEQLDRVTLTGSQTVNGVRQSHAKIWQKTVDFSGSSTVEEPWFCMNDDNNPDKLLPASDTLSVVAYNNGLLALTINNASDNANAFEPRFYSSITNGLYWSQNSIYTLPSIAQGQASNYTFAVDNDQYIWLLIGGSGQVWRGRLSQLGWTTEPKAYTRY